MGKLGELTAALLVVRDKWNCESKYMKSVLTAAFDKVNEFMDYVEKTKDMGFGT